MTDAPDDKLPDHVTYLKRLVTALSVVMIAGFLVLIASLVIQLNADPLPLPERIELPDDVQAIAFTQGTDWFAVVTSGDQILIYDRATSTLRQTIDVE